MKIVENVKMPLTHLKTGRIVYIPGRYTVVLRWDQFGISECIIALNHGFYIRWLLISRCARVLISDGNLEIGTQVLR